jgi:hypothetical protein
LEEHTDHPRFQARSRGRTRIVAILVVVFVTLMLGACGSSGSAAGSACNGHPCIGDWQREQANGGTVVECQDGAWSHAGGLSGACSSHGGEAGGGDPPWGFGGAHPSWGFGG